MHRIRAQIGRGLDARPARSAAHAARIGNATNGVQTYVSVMTTAIRL